MIRTPRTIQAMSRQRTAMRSKLPSCALSKALSSTIRHVVDGCIDSLQSNGEGVLPILLVLQPDLSTRGIPESDAEFARRGRRQSAAERRFFRTIEAALRESLGTILEHAALEHAARAAGSAPRSTRADHS